jgi:2-polyprenyl-3-methyl-5-hydroxy-6-metoxy-1,4-benzoquinol methylase
MKIITTLEELDAQIAACDAAATDADLRTVFRSFKMRHALRARDPFSKEYADAQFNLYEQIAGRSYRLENEETTFDVEQISSCPFPYSTGNTRIIGEQLLAIGSLLRHMRLPADGRILEFGPGWGNTTVALAQAGFHVTAVDIEPRFCELLARRASQLEVDIEIINDDFMWAEKVQERYDAIVFFECFHHCADHVRLLRALAEAVKPGGRIFFVGEPITHSFPIPWGLRLDGESLWAIRKHGWLELGFNEIYFRKVLASTGWCGIKYQSLSTSTATVWEVGRTEQFRPTLGQRVFSVTLSRLASLASGILRNARAVRRLFGAAP